MATAVTELYPAWMLEDLLKSGLEPIDMKARLAGPNEKQATNTPAGINAYVLPYFDMYGKPLPFYRTKLINSPDPKLKYKQVATSSNHVYFPPGLHAILKGARYLFITEGEKKAAAAVKAGFPCVGLGGVDSWKNRTITLDKDTQVGVSKAGGVAVKLPAGSDISEHAGTLATGMQQLIDYCIRHRTTIVICFDSDLQFKERTGFNVQRAAATLGYELRYRGVPFHQIKQLVLDPEDSGISDKLGLDDFLMNEDLGPDSLEQQLNEVISNRAAFPKHPNPKEFVNRKLQRNTIPRGDLQAISTAILCDLDTKGLRLHNPADDNMYYFDEKSFKLMKVRFTQQMDFSQTPFGVKLYNEYGLTSADLRVLTVLNAQFCGEQPVQKVKPEKVMCCRGDAIYFQISDGMMVRVNSKEMRIMPNGSDDVLFEGDMVKPVPHQQLIAAVQIYKNQEILTNNWYPVLQGARIKESTNDYGRKLLSLLYSISPWFYRWRSTQLPIEQMLGEAGSGKSTLFSLRQQIISGITHLRNAPRDLRDWTASVASSGALHVTDNVHMVNGQLKQQLSDELCRVITEMDPHIESRKLYTDNDLIRVPVRSVFAVTAIKQPFTNTDIIQRSIITELDKGLDEVSYDADWEGTQLKKYGGRVHWIAHQLVFLHRMLKMVETEWQPSYKARFRLINVEQLLILAAKVYGMDWQWIPGYLESSRDERTAKSDAALEGLLLWADSVREGIPERLLANRGFTTQDMVQFFEADDEWDDHPILTNGRKLGHYLDDKKNVISTIVGIQVQDFKKNNRVVYKVTHIDNHG